MLLNVPGLSPVIYRLRPNMTTDSYGDPVEDWTVAQPVPLIGAHIQAVSSTDADGATVHVSENEKKLFVPGDPGLQENDRIEIKAELWRIDGTPEVRAGLATETFTTATLTRLVTS